MRVCPHVYVRICGVVILITIISIVIAKKKTLAISFFRLKMAYAFETTVTLAGGDLRTINLKAYLTPDRSWLRWELRRILPMCDYEEKSSRTKLCNRMKPWMDALGADAAAFGWNVADSLGIFANAARYRNDRVAEGVVDGQSVSSGDQEFWVSTPMLFNLLLFFSHLRKGNVRKSRINDIAAHLLKVTCPADVNLLSTSDHIGDNIRTMCQKDYDADTERCRCVGERLGLVGTLPRHTSNAEFVWNAIQCLAAEAPNCLAVRHLLGQVFALIGEAVANNVDAWGRKEVMRITLELKGPSGSKKRRLDEHMRAFVVSEAILEKRGSAPTVIARAHGLADGCAQVWTQNSFAEYLAANRLSNSVPGVHHIALDAATVGKPEKEFMLMHQAVFPSGANCVMPPKE